MNASPMDIVVLIHGLGRSPRSLLAMKFCYGGPDIRWSAWRIPLAG